MSLQRYRLLLLYLLHMYRLPPSTPYSAQISLLFLLHFLISQKNRQTRLLHLKLAMTWLVLIHLHRSGWSFDSRRPIFLVRTLLATVHDVVLRAYSACAILDENVIRFGLIFSLF
jgi:hypothetical protein